MVGEAICVEGSDPWVETGKLTVGESVVAGLTAVLDGIIVTAIFVASPPDWGVGIPPSPVMLHPTANTRKMNRTREKCLLATIPINPLRRLRRLI